jgi:hypothetical protein
MLPWGKGGSYFTPKSKRHGVLVQNANSLRLLLDLAHILYCNNRCNNRGGRVIATVTTVCSGGAAEHSDMPDISIWTRKSGSGRDKVCCLRYKKYDS